MGAVIFTLLVQGLTMEWLVQSLGLNKPLLLDRFSRVEGDLAAKKQALERVPELSAGGLFSGTIGERLRSECESSLAVVRKQRDALQSEELNLERESNLVFLRSFVEEKTYYIDMFAKAHLSERSLRNILSVIDLQMDAIRLTGSYSAVRSHRTRRKRWQRALYRSFDRWELFRRLTEHWRLAAIAISYEETWGHYQGSARVLRYIRSIKTLGVASVESVEEVEAHFQGWHEEAQLELDEIAEQYPEFVQAMQERLGRRMILLAEEKSIQEHARRGLLSHAIAEQMEEAIAHKMRRLRGHSVDRLKISPNELLRMVPFFREIEPAGFDAIALRMRSSTHGRDEEIIRQGDAGDTLFLIARGVVRVSRFEFGEKRDLATLMAGDFFGEMAVLHGERRAFGPSRRARSIL
jgi:CPA1 family monovalent cation:H+ antiporter